MTQIVAERLHAQRLTGQPFESAVRAVRWMGAVQSQDYEGAKWALGQRTQGTTAAELDLLFDQGGILRTHLLRPTWHFVAPEDVRWLLELTGPRIRRALAFRYRQVEIDDEQIARAESAITSALAGGRHLTRSELGEVLAQAGISPEGQRLPHLIMAAELDGLVASGPRRGKQFTYALLEERTPRARRLDLDEAVVELTRRYFLSHGPAQVLDFVWWSGLTARERAGASTAPALRWCACSWMARSTGSMLRHVLAPRPRASCASCPTSMSTRLGTATEPPRIRRGPSTPASSHSATSFRT